MIGIVSNNGTHNYNYKEFVVDTPEDIQYLPKVCAAGSTAFVVSNGDVYMLNNLKEWKLI